MGRRSGLALCRHSSMLLRCAPACRSASNVWSMYVSVGTDPGSQCGASLLCVRSPPHRLTDWRQAARPRVCTGHTHSHTGLYSSSPHHCLHHTANTDSKVCVILPRIQAVFINIVNVIMGFFSFSFSSCIALIYLLLHYIEI